MYRFMRGKLQDPSFPSPQRSMLAESRAGSQAHSFWGDSELLGGEACVCLVDLREPHHRRHLSRSTVQTTLNSGSLLPRASRVISTQNDSTQDALEVSGSFRDSLLPLWPQGVLPIQMCQQGRGDLTFPPQQIPDRPSLSFPGIGRGFRACCTHSWLSFSWAKKNLHSVCASWVGLCKLLMPKENH